MKVSSYTQYYVRKLLKRQVSQLGYPHSGIGLRNYLWADITSLLEQQYSQNELPMRVQELEKLIELHAKVKMAFQASYNLTQIEQKILWLLGLKFLALLSDMALEIVPEVAVTRFQFLLEQRTQQGMRYRNRLYGQVLEFGADYDLAACRLLFMLNSRQVPFWLTASEVRHSIWIDLCSPMYLWLLNQPLSSHKVA